MKISILILIFAVILVSGCTQYPNDTTLTQNPSHTQNTIQTSQPPSSVLQPTQSTITTNSPKTEATFDYESLPKYASRYYRYSKEAYQAAVNEKAIVYLYFYANWCPICRESRPKILEAFNKMNFDDVIGFEVHFNDDQVTDEDKEITRNYQIPYQHTTIIAKNGEQVFKSLEELSTERLIEEIGKTRGQ